MCFSIMMCVTFFPFLSRGGWARARLARVGGRCYLNSGVV
uniref:Uncharacterized protein n=1 Tax=Anguilla anguilla TaxID=7936 RepID=A0A0E9RAS6_ANGAN